MSKELEAIIEAKKENGNIFFKVKWKGEVEPQVMLATVVNIRYPQAVMQYYEDHIIFEDEKKQKLVNLKLERIIDVVKCGDKMVFLVKWKNRDTPTLMTAEEAHSKYSHAVIKYYEKGINWVTSRSHEEEGACTSTVSSDLKYQFKKKL